MSQTTGLAVKTASASYDEQELDQHVQRVAKSAQFMRAETLKKLLVYLWVHRNEEISEYAVATEALGRRADFDPKTDASVRVQISRLRRKLKDFYETEGLGGPHLLHIPVGTHVLTVLDDSLRLSIPPGPDQEVARFSIGAWTQPLLAVACVALLILSGWLLWDRHKVTGAVQRPVVQPARFWASFLGRGASVKIILPTPVFFVYPKLPKLHLRDVGVNDFESWQKSDSIASLAKLGGNPALDQSYTVTSDTLAAIDLAHYLDTIGMADRVVFETTGDSSVNLLEKANVIALGAYSTLYPFRDYLESMNFSIGPNEDWVENAHPEAGEPRRYAVASEGVGRRIEPAIVAVLPGRGPNLKLLIMQSIHTHALVGMLTSDVGNSLFEKIYTAHGSPVYFEMVIESEIAGNRDLRSWPIAIHAYTKNPPTGTDVTQ